MTLQFEARKEHFTFHDPMQDGKLVHRETEIRYDPLTGETSRILFDPGAPFIPPQYNELGQATSGQKCPFCAENIFTATPRFPAEVIESGRFTQGEAVLFPNLFPYSKHNGVVRMCDQHYVKLGEFTQEWIENAFGLAAVYLLKVKELDPEAQYASINWNYLPPSGGSILHPHLHVLASEHATRYQWLYEQAMTSYYHKHETSYFHALIAEEKKRNERWIGSVDELEWVHAFAPRGHHDLIGVWKDIGSLEEMSAAHYRSLAHSLLHIFRYFEQVGLASFNMALHLPLKPTAGSSVHLRLIPRITIGALQTSDMNVLNYVQSEALSLKRPEEVAKEIASYF